MVYLCLECLWYLERSETLIVTITSTFLTIPLWEWIICFAWLNDFPVSYIQLINRNLVFLCVFMPCRSLNLSKAVGWIDRNVVIIWWVRVQLLWWLDFCVPWVYLLGSDFLMRAYATIRYNLHDHLAYVYIFYQTLVSCWVAGGSSKLRRWVEVCSETNSRYRRQSSSWRHSYSY